MHKLNESCRTWGIFHKELRSSWYKSREVTFLSSYHIFSHFTMVLLLWHIKICDSCCDMRKIVTWLNHILLSESKMRFSRWRLSVHKLFVKWTPRWIITWLALRILCKIIIIPYVSIQTCSFPAVILKSVNQLFDLNLWCLVLPNGC